MSSQWSRTQSTPPCLLYTEYLTASVVVSAGAQSSKGQTAEEAAGRTGQQLPGLRLDQGFQIQTSQLLDRGGHDQDSRMHNQDRGTHNQGRMVHDQERWSQNQYRWAHNQDRSVHNQERWTHNQDRTIRTLRSGCRRASYVEWTRH